MSAPDRVFIDDFGRRWEWCGGVEGTWAWRITAIPEPTYRQRLQEALDSVQRMVDEANDRLRDGSGGLRRVAQCKGKLDGLKLAVHLLEEQP